jgi:hypothetical protein
MKRIIAVIPLTALLCSAISSASDTTTAPQLSPTSPCRLESVVPLPPSPIETALDALYALDDIDPTSKINHQNKLLGAQCADLALQGAGIAGSLYLLDRAHIPDVIKRQRTRLATGAEASLLGATGEVLGSLLKPAAGIGFGFFMWHKVKSSIIEPYKLRQQTEIEKIRAAEEKFKEDMRKSLEEVGKQHKQQITELRDKINEWRKEQEKEDETRRKELADLQEANKTLRDSVKTVVDETKEQLHTLAIDTTTLRTTQREIERGTSSARSKLEDIAGIVHTLAKQSADLATRLNNKKDKKPEKKKPESSKDSDEKRGESSKKRFGIF